MWIAENLSKNTINKPTAESGNVVMSEIGNNAIIASGEYGAVRPFNSVTHKRFRQIECCHTRQKKEQA